MPSLVYLLSATLQNDSFHVAMWFLCSWLSSGTLSKWLAFFRSFSPSLFSLHCFGENILQQRQCKLYFCVSTSANFFWFFQHWIRFCYKSHVDTLPSLFFRKCVTAFYLKWSSVTLILCSQLKVMLCHSAVLRYRDRSTWCCVTGVAVKYFKSASVNRRVCMRPLHVTF